MEPLQGYEQFYEINPAGGVFSLRRKHLLKYRISNGGYRRVMLYDKTGHKELSVHRLVGIQYLPNKEGKPDINHIDGNKLNNHVSNLEWVTKAENSQHAVRLGLMGCWNSNKNGKLSGEGNGRCKLSDKTVTQMRKEYTGKRGELKRMGEHYNVHWATVSRIVNNKQRTNGGQIGN